IFVCSSRRRHTRSKRDWSSDVCSSDLIKTKEDLFSVIKQLQDDNQQLRTDLDSMNQKSESDPNQESTEKEPKQEPTKQEPTKQEPTEEEVDEIDKLLNED